MDDKKITNAVIGVGFATIAVNAIVWGGLALIVIHFVRKYW